MGNDIKTPMLLAGFFSAIATLLIVFEYLFRFDFLQPTGEFYPYIYDILVPLSMPDNLIILKAVTLLMIFFTFWLKPNRKDVDDDSTEAKLKIFGFSIISIGIFLMPYNKLSIFLYPLSFLLSLGALTKLASLFASTVKSEKPLSTIPSKYKLSTQSVKLPIVDPRSKYITIYNIFMGTIIEGGAGSGKSASLVEPLIDLLIKQHFCGFIYDLKGNPPTLSTTAYSALIRHKDKYNLNTKFGMINLAILSQSVAVNPLSTKYIKDKADAMAASISFLKALNPEWRDDSKQDFWAGNAFILFAAAIHRVCTDPDLEPLRTLPHVISMMLSPPDQIFNFLNDDEETRSMITGVTDGMQSPNQMSGVLTSFKNPMQKIKTPQLYWVFREDGFNLTLNDPDDPRVLCLANDKPRRDVYSAALTMVAQIVKRNMAQPGRKESFFIVDELDSLFIDKLWELPAESRSEKIATVLAFQDFSQVERTYGNKAAEVIRANCGNMFMGMTNNTNSAKKTSDMLGTYKKAKQSFSDSDSGRSTSNDTTNEKVMQEKDVMGQEIGHFTGKIAGIKNPYFSVQLSEYVEEKIPIPHYGYPVEIEGASKEEQDELLNKLVKDNYDRINEEANMIMESYSSIKIVQ
jgi:hypothetical protein